MGRIRVGVIGVVVVLLVGCSPNVCDLDGIVSAIDVTALELHDGDDFAITNWMYAVDVSRTEERLIEQPAPETVYVSVDCDERTFQCDDEQKVERIRASPFFESSESRRYARQLHVDPTVSTDGGGVIFQQAAVVEWEAIRNECWVKGWVGDVVDVRDLADGQSNVSDG